MQVGTTYFYIAVSVGKRLKTGLVRLANFLAITIGKIGVHIWDVSVAFVTSTKFLIVRSSRLFINKGY